MRKAAGVLLIIFGVFLLVAEISTLETLVVYWHRTQFFPLRLLHIVFPVIIVAGGILCIVRRYWGVCLASALLVLYMVIGWLISGYKSLDLEQLVLPIVLAVLPIILVCTRRKEWQEISDSVDCEVSNGG